MKTIFFLLKLLRVSNYQKSIPSFIGNTILTFLPNTSIGEYNIVIYYYYIYYTLYVFYENKTKSLRRSLWFLRVIVVAEYRLSNKIIMSVYNID